MNIADGVEFAIQAALEAGNDEVEVAASLVNVTTTMIESNEVRLTKSQRFTPLGIRTLRGKSQGFATTNVVTKASIRKCVKEATSISNVSPPDVFNNIPSGGKVGPLEGIYDRETVNAAPSDIVQKAAEMLEFVKSYDSRIRIDGGSFSAAEDDVLIVNSNGRAGRQRTTLTSWELIGMAVDDGEVSSFDVAHGSHHFFRRASPEESLREFCSTVISSLKARKSEPFHGSLIMSPDSFAEILVSPLMEAACAMSVQKGRSPLTGKVGQKLSSKLLTISDDGTCIDGSMASGFDREGTASRKTRVLDEGVLTTFLHSCYTAARDGAESTGSASGGASSPPDNGPSNIVVEAGSQPMSSLLEETSSGILVNRFSGNVDSTTGDFSGVVKGGYLVQNGQVVHPVKETLVAGNVYQLLNTISGISRERKTLGNYILPYVKVEDVSII